jgi:hypothetical protein
LREYFPLLKQRCKVEGLLMQDFLATGDEKLLNALRELDQNTISFCDKCFP